MPDNYSEMVVLDVETTGTDHRCHQVLTLDAVCIRREDGLTFAPVGDPFSAKVAKTSWSEVDPAALAINGINLGRWEGETEAQVTVDLVRWVRETLGGGYKLFTGYNAGFDRGFVEQMFRRSQIRWPEAFSFRGLDILQLVAWSTIRGVAITDKKGNRRQMSGDTLPDLKLETVAKFLGVHRPGAHDSAVDVAMTVDVLNKILEASAQTVLL